MTTPITITILSTGLDPALPPRLTQGDTVHFKLGEGVGPTDVYFDHPSRLVGSPNPLHVGPEGASVTIASDAPKGHIDYGPVPQGQARPPRQVPPRGGGDVVTGGLDVTTEPPPPPKF
jgi:hypothetical protein